MSEWKKVKIGDFLTEREGRYKPDDSKISKYKRLDKIDFSGTIHISDKPTKTDMIIVHPGDLVISGINVAKGAVAVYQGDEPVCATIHYSSYTFDSSKVDLDYFKYFVKSPEFIAALQKQVKGGIKTEIKPKHLLPLEISIPDLQTQQEIVKKISLQLKKTEQLSVEIESQKNYIKQLRKNILQDAIEGNLTAEWRKQNPVQKGNPDYDAEALFEQIQKERINEKKQKELSPITDEEKSFEISEGWRWVRLGDIINLLSGRDFEPSEYNDKQKGIPYITGASNFGETGIIINRWTETPKCIAKFGDLLLVCKGSGYGTLAYADFKEAHIARQVMSITTVSELFSLKYIEFILRANFQYLKTQGKGLIPGIDRETVLNICAGLPSLLEQEEIVKSVEKHLQTVSDIESQITEREQLTKQLMQSILKDAFEEKKIDFTRV